MCPPPETLLWRIHDGYSFGTSRGPTVPCDFIGSFRGRPIMLECKSTIEDALPFSVLLKRLHQFESMKRFTSAHPGNMAGYLCQVRDKYSFIPVHLVGDRGSVNEAFILSLNLYWGGFDLGRAIEQAITHRRM